MTRMMMGARFELSDGSTIGWDGPADGNLFDEGLPPQVKKALDDGLVVIDTLEFVTYSKKDGQIIMTVPSES